jgi:hypothetical protein
MMMNPRNMEELKELFGPIVETNNDLRKGIESIIDIKLLLIQNIFSFDKTSTNISTTFGEIVGAETLFSKTLALAPVIDTATDSLRRLNFVFKTCQCMIQFCTTDDAQQFKRDFLSYPINSLLSSRYIQMQVSKRIRPYLDRTQAIWLGIPIDNTRGIFTAATRGTFSQIMAKLLFNEGQRGIQFAVSKLIPIYPRTTSTTPNNDDKQPISKRQRELLKDGLRGKELQLVLLKEFPDYKPINLDELLNDESMNPTLDMLKNLLQDVQTFLSSSIRSLSGPKGLIFTELSQVTTSAQCIFLYSFTLIQLNALRPW